MEQDVKAFCKGCVLCNINKSSLLGKSELGTPRLVLQPFDSWQIDICSGLTSVNGQKSFLNMIDLYSGFTIPVALKNENSKTIAQVLDEHLIKVFGPPREISCDNAANLSGPEVKRLLAFYNVKLRRTVPYSPESHSLVENSNRYLIELIRLFSDQYKTTWPNVLSLATLIVNSVPRPQLKNHSPYYLIFQNEILKGKKLLHSIRRDIFRHRCTCQKKS
jgi:hypothetical protein